MVWFMIAAAAVSAVSSASTNKANADSALAWNEYNNRLTQANADWQVGEIAAASAFDSQMTMAMSNLNAQSILDNSEYNAMMRQKTGTYNSQLLRNEAEVMWDKFELDEDQFEKRMDQVSSNNRVAYGASGVMLDQDSPLQAEISLRTEEAFEIEVMRYNTNLAATKLLDAAALGDWETRVAVDQLVYEGRMNASATLAGDMFKVEADAIGATGQSNSILYNASMGIATSTAAAMQTASQYNQAASNAIISGMVKAGSTAYSAYGTGQTNSTYPNTNSAVGFSTSAGTSTVNKFGGPMTTSYNSGSSGSGTYTASLLDT